MTMSESSARRFVPLSELIDLLIEAKDWGEPRGLHTDSLYPDAVWPLADKVAEQGEIKNADYETLNEIYEEWQDDLNEEDALSQDEEDV